MSEENSNNNENVEQIVGDITFTDKGQTYIYNFKKLNLEQVELAREAGEYKLQTALVNPESWDALHRSGSLEWMHRVASYLLLQKDSSGALVEFDRDIAESIVISWVKKLPATYRDEILRMLNDFFTSSGLTQLGSALLQSGKGSAKLNSAWKLVSMMMKKS